MHVGSSRAAAATATLGESLGAARKPRGNVGHAVQLGCASEGLENLGTQLRHWQPSQSLARRRRAHRVVARVVEALVWQHDLARLQQLEPQIELAPQEVVLERVVHNVARLHMDSQHRHSYSCIVVPTATASSSRLLDHGQNVGADLRVVVLARHEGRARKDLGQRTRERLVLVGARCLERSCLGLRHDADLEASVHESPRMNVLARRRNRRRHEVLVLMAHDVQQLGRYLCSIRCCVSRCAMDE